MSDVRPREAWRYYRSFRTWKRGDRSFVLPQCRMGIDSARMLAEAGVLTIGRATRCEEIDGHDGTHRSSFPEFAVWGESWAKEVA